MKVLCADCHYEGEPDQFGNCWRCGMDHIMPVPDIVIDASNDKPEEVEPRSNYNKVVE